MVDRSVAGSRTRAQVVMRLSLVAEVPVVAYLLVLFSMSFWSMGLMKKRAMSNIFYLLAYRGGQRQREWVSKADFSLTGETIKGMYSWLSIQWKQTSNTGQNP